MSETKLSDNARRVLEARYLRRDEHGAVVETPNELFERVARAIGEAGKRCDGRDFSGAYHGLLNSLDFLPNSPTLMNAGAERGQLSACFVLPIEDSVAGIFESLKGMALVQQTGGGTGFSFSRLRPRGDLVRSTGGEASGPVSFLRIFDCATDNIKQGGRRRGANMGILRVDHPDIMEFVRFKTDDRNGRNFNLSVGVTDAFMEAVESGSGFELRHPGSGRVVEAVEAAAIFEAIAGAAWRCGDPGLVFLDTINRANPTPRLGAIEATNPCGEIPLLPYEACNLGSVNLSHMVARVADEPRIDREKLDRTVRLSIRFLDDVIEASCFPLDEIGQMVRGNRKVGLGVMGFAEMLILLGISYDSDEAVRIAGQLMQIIGESARSASMELAEERGVFPNWEGSVHEEGGRRMRNATCTAIAPTGTIGIIAGTSAGIEPLFALACRRSHALGGEPLTESNRLFRERLSVLGERGDRILRAVEGQGNLRGIEGVPEELRTLFVTALEIPPDRHLEIQAACQQHVDNSVSKTINLPPEATPEEIGGIYRRAWQLGLKGITVFRYGSRETQVLELGSCPGAGRCDA